MDKQVSTGIFQQLGQPGCGTQVSQDALTSNPGRSHLLTSEIKRRK